MTDYFGISENQLETYKSRYALKPEKGYLKLACLGFRYFIRELKKYKFYQNIDKNSFNIGVLVEGGIGDLLHAALYVERLGELFSNANIFVFTDREKIARIIFNGTKARVSEKKNISYNKFNLVFTLSLNIPNLIYYSKGKSLSKKENDYISSTCGFSERYRSILNGRFQLNQLDFMLLRGKNCITSLDITDKLGINNDSSLNLIIPEEGYQIYEKFPVLRTRKYITIARSVDTINKNRDSTRLWSVEKYEQFIDIFKKKFPEVKIVYLGPDKKSCKPLKGVDIDLVGKTTLSELMVVLKGAALHLDSEGGMTHLRHFICRKKSIVLFGPTSPKLRSHPENINIRNDSKCVLPFCEHIISNGEWSNVCQLNGSDRCRCLESISAQYVVGLIKKV